MDEAEMKDLIHKLITWFQELFGKPYEPPVIEPEPLPEPEPIPEPTPLPSPKILSIESLNKDTLIKVTYESETPVEVAVSGGGFSALGEDKESPLYISVDSNLGNGFEVIDGRFVGDIIVEISNAAGRYKKQIYITPPKPVQPPPAARPPRPNPPKFLNEINLTANASGRVIKKADHPSKRTVQLLNNDALIMFDSAGHVFSVASGRFVGQIAKGEGANKAEFCPSVYGDYYFNREGGLYRRNLFDSGRNDTIFTRTQVWNEYSETYGSIVSGDFEHYLMNENMIAAFRATRGNRSRVFAYDVAAKRFLKNTQTFIHRNGTPDFVGMVGDSFILKNNAQDNGLNQNFHFDLFPITSNGVGEPFIVDRKGMNHTCFDGENIVSTAGWYASPKTGITQPIGVSLDTGEHIGAVHGLDGWCVANQRNGNVVFFETVTGIDHIIARDCVRQGYPVAFMYQGQLKLAITTTRGVFLRSYTV